MCPFLYLIFWLLSIRVLPFFFCCCFLLLLWFQQSYSLSPCPGHYRGNFHRSACEEIFRLKSDASPLDPCQGSTDGVRALFFFFFFFFGNLTYNILTRRISLGGKYLKSQITLNLLKSIKEGGLSLTCNGSLISASGI